MEIWGYSGQAVLLHLTSLPIMKKQIVQISAVQSAKVVAGIYLVTAIPACLIMALVSSLTNQAGVGLAMLVLMPLLYAALGFIVTVIGAAIYNLVAAKLGGLEYITAEVAAVPR